MPKEERPAGLQAIALLLSFLSVVAIVFVHAYARPSFHDDLVWVCCLLGGSFFAFYLDCASNYNRPLTQSVFLYFCCLLLFTALGWSLNGFVFSWFAEGPKDDPFWDEPSGDDNDAGDDAGDGLSDGGASGEMLLLSEEFRDAHERELVLIDEQGERCASLYGIRALRYSTPFRLYANAFRSGNRGTMKIQFRNLAKLFHPDRATGGCRDFASNTFSALSTFHTS